MKYLFATHANSFIFNMRPDENIYEILLKKLGHGQQIKKLVSRYNKNYKKGPLLLKDVTALFSGVKKSSFEFECKKFSQAIIRKEFLQIVKILKARGHKIAILSSYPAELFKSLPSDFIIATELESKSGVLTGKYMKMKISASALKKLKKLSSATAKSFLKSKGEPNRHGLAAKLFEIAQKEKLKKILVLGDSIKSKPLFDVIE